MLLDKAGTTLIAYPGAQGEVTESGITSIGERAFSACYALAEVSLPEATSIGDRAFEYCKKLATVSLPKAESIGKRAFLSCDTLATVSLPEATSIGEWAFDSCTALATVSLPEATSIGDGAFAYCEKLATVSLPKADLIYGSAFGYTGGTALTVTLGDTPPWVESGMFFQVNESKKVTVKVPSGAKSSYDTTWQKAFKGVGNTGISGSVNSKISLTVVGY
jgi:hypothetical protein